MTLTGLLVNPMTQPCFTLTKTAAFLADRYCKHPDRAQCGGSG